jgi:multiple sugar transport system substrate-binding protein
MSSCQSSRSHFLLSPLRILLIAILLTGLYGCRPLPSATSTVPVEVHWLNNLILGESRIAAAEQSLVDRFNASHPGIHLTAEPPSAGETDLDQLRTEIAAGNGPDLIGPYDFPYENDIYDQFLDLEPLARSAGYDLEQFNPNLLASYRSSQGLVGLPFIAYPAALFYQKEMFTRAGLNPPPSRYGVNYVWPDGTQTVWDYASLARAARLLTLDAQGRNAGQADFDRTAIVQYGFAPQWQDSAQLADFFGGGSLLTQDGRMTIPDGYRQAWEWYYDGIWGQQPFIPDGSTATQDQFGRGSYFDSGTVAMVTGQSWLLCCLDHAGEHWDLAALPSFQGKVHGRVDAETIYIWKGTRHPREAFIALTYLIGPASGEWVGLLEAVPGRIADQDQALANLFQPFPWASNWAVFKAGLEVPDTPHTEPGQVDWLAVSTRMTDFQNQLAMDGRLDLEAQFKTLQADLQTIADRSLK